jgi:polysaccharide export outer membrane protein
VGKYKANLMKHSAMVLAAACALALGGCATRGQQPIETQVSDTEYLIGPGDAVNIIVWRNPEVSMSVPVRPDGKITTPLVEDLPAAGKTSTALARDIEKALSKYIQQPVVTVVVTSFVGNYAEQIRVIGQATKPQALPYRRNMSLMDVMIAVGGTTEFASGNRASLIRTVDGKQQRFNVRLDDLIKSGDISANVPMRPGDILVIPESFF